MSDLLSTATSALLTAQRSLSVVGHNVANMATEGYSRQRVDQTAVVLNGQGAGVTTTGIQRLADSLVFGRSLTSSGESGRLQALATMTGRVDSLMSDSATALAGPWSDFLDSISGVAADPSSLTARQEMLNQAEALVARFHLLDGQLDAMGTETSEALRGDVDSVNRLSAEIATLNASIAGSGNPSPDLLDKRDALVSDLVGLTGGTAVVQDDGAMNVFTAGGTALVVGGTASTLSAVADPYRPDRVSLVLEANGQSVAMASDAFGGEIGGLLEFQDDVLDPALAELGRLAAGLAQAVNDVLAGGTDYYGNAGSDLFSVPAPTAAPARTNTGGASLQASIADLGAVTGDPVVLSYAGGSWIARDASTGATVPMTGAGTAADPFLVGGVALVLQGTAAAGDSFRVEPTAGAAGTLDLAMSDPNRIAAAAPVKASAATSNLGTGSVAGIVVADATDPELRTASTITFIDAGQYTIDGEGPFAYTAGAPIEHNGWSLTLDGAPSAGDTFDVAASTSGSSDNTVARALAGIGDSSLLDGDTRSLNNVLAQLTTTVGAQARQAEYALEGQTAIAEEVAAQRDSISGVNLDEEAANMLKFQQAYMAASQLISAADTMFQALLGATSR